MTIYYVYAYIRKSNFTPYYIGKGTGDRAYSKCHSVSVPNDNSRIIFLKENLSEVDAFSYEREMISLYGRKDLGTGILRNRTDGGEGASGLIWSEKSKKKQSDANKGEKNPFYGKSHPAATIKKISSSQKGIPRKRHTEEWKKNHSEKMTGRSPTEETRKKLSEVKKGPQRIVICPHCSTSGGISNMNRWHFDRCKHK